MVQFDKKGKMTKALSTWSPYMIFRQIVLFVFIVVEVRFLSLISTTGLESISYRRALLIILLHVTVLMLNNLLNIMVQIAY
jgi:hypothetical protein